jgi:hypothetical protein
MAKVKGPSRHMGAINPSQNGSGARRQNFAATTEIHNNRRLSLRSQTRACYATNSFAHDNTSHGRPRASQSPDPKEWRRLPRLHRAGAHGALRRIALAAACAEVRRRPGVGSDSPNNTMRCHVNVQQAPRPSTAPSSAPRVASTRTRTRSSGRACPRANSRTRTSTRRTVRACCTASTPSSSRAS